METRFPSLEIDLLGGFRVRVGMCEVPAAAWRLSKARALLKLLALAPGHRLPRDQVLDLLWPDLAPEAAANNLYQAVHSLRRALGASRECPVVILDRVAVSIDPAVPIRTDIDTFESAVKAARAGREPDGYEAAAAIYQGDLLPDDLYDDWAAGRREYLRERYLGLLVELAGVYDRAGQLDRAIDTVRRVIALDPIREEAHTLLMRLLAAQGRRQEALRQYTLLREALWNELGVEPDRETERLYAEILSGSFGRTAPRPPLPVPLTSFIGREEEMQALRGLMAGQRLVTVIGPGGSGKTRLALAAVSGRSDETVADSDVFFADLASIADWRTVPVALLRACGLQVRSHPVEALADGLGSRQVLLVLDNCERLLPSLAELAASLLTRCRGLHILATSREPLYAAGEVLFRVPPLRLPAGEDEESIRNSEAGRLFLERAAARSRDFMLDGNASTPATLFHAVAEICRRLDGMPLAIELAAARVGTLPVSQIAGRLDDALTLLASEDRTGHPRHRALRATLDWSYSMLSTEEQAVFQRLGIFLGGFGLVEAESVCADLVDRREVLGLLARFVDRSLLVVGTAGREARFHLAEPVRQYARELLERSADARTALARHADVYLTLAHRACPELRGAAQREWMERLALDHDNLRAALDWLIADGETERAIGMAGDLWRFWQMHGDIGEGIRRLEAVAAMEGSVSSEAHARVLNGLTALVYRQGDLRRAAALSEDAVAFSRAHKLTQELAAALNNRGAMVHNVAGSTDEAIAILEESLGLHRTLGNELGVTTSLHNLGRAYSSKGRYDLALRCYEEVLALRRASGDAFGIAEALNSMGLTAIRLGEHTQAVAMFEEALPIFEQAGNRGGMATILSCLGESSLAMGKPDEAIGYLDRAMELYREVGEERGQVVVTTSRMQLALMRDDRALALQFARQAIGVCLAHSYRSEVIAPLFGMAQLSVGDPEVAARLLGAAEGALTRLGQTTDDWEDSVISAVGECITAAVGPDRFEQLREEGRAFSEGDAEALALTVSS